MARHAHEFHCTECRGFNYPMLDEELPDGNYTLVCGGCQHKHYRVVKKGVVTEDRHNHALDHGDTIHVMPSAFSKEKRQLGMVAQMRAMALAGLTQ